MSLSRWTRSASTIDTSLSRSDMSLRFLIVGPSGSRRIAAFQAALARNGIPFAQGISYREAYLHIERFEKLLGETDIVRLESPGEDWDSSSLFMELAQECSAINPAPKVEEFLEGRIYPFKSWYQGLERVFISLGETLARFPSVRRMNDLSDLLTFYDKYKTYSLLKEGGIPQPPRLKKVDTFEELLSEMERENVSRVFIKPRYGSSASGIIALQMQKGRLLAATTVEVVESGRELRLYNSRRLHYYRERGAVQKVVEGVLENGAQVERWIPKASFDGKIFDLRVVAIGGRASHFVVRSSSSPITNLHLGNSRGDWPGIQERAEPGLVKQIVTTTERVMDLFPRSLYAGLDIAISNSYQRHYLLEVNGFGDYHRGVLVDGLETYDCEIKKVMDA